MDKTRIEQDSIEETLSDGSTVFQITTSVTDPGILPDTGLFVFDIVDPLEPKSDTFIRVAQPQDINFMLRDRDNAIAAGDTEYLYFRVVLQYSSLEVAIQAKAAIKSRIDSAISRWYQYQIAFVGVVETLHPGVDPAYEQALKDTYVAARTARVTAEESVTAADDAITAAQVLLEHAQEILDIRKTEIEFCTTVNGTVWPALQLGWSSFYGGAEALYASSKTFWLALVGNYNSFPDDPPDPPYNGPPTSEPNWIDFYNTINGYGPHTTVGTSLAAFQAFVDAYTTTSALITAMSTGLSTFCATATSAYSAALVAVTQKEAAVSVAVNTKNEAEAELASAQETEDAALAAVVDCCPDFETTSV